MKLVLQRVLSASVWVNEVEVSRISTGILVFFAAIKGDTTQSATYLAKKVAQLRIFPDENEKMNKSCLEIGGEVLVVSQFTLASDCSHGRRPSFDQAIEPILAEPIYEFFVQELERIGLNVMTGQFGANMTVHIQNEGPATFFLEK